jgi:site-specific DNA-methyltransferase (adenine-specific)
MFGSQSTAADERYGVNVRGKWHPGAEPVVRQIGEATLILQDALVGMAGLPDASFDLAIADPPYGASTRATWELPRGHNLPGFGGAWKLAAHEWDRLAGLEGFTFAMRWLAELKRLVRPTGSIWIHATYHNAGIINVACQLLGLEIINEVIWLKRNAFPNLARRRLTASHETILWVHTGRGKRQYRFNYEAAKSALFPGDSLKEPGKQLRTVWDIPNNKTPEELRFGRHPTQKPLRLTERMLLVSSLPGGTMLVPFMGSGTEVVAALRWNMRPTGFEIDRSWFTLACKRTAAEVARLEKNPALFSAYESEVRACN